MRALIIGASRGIGFEFVRQYCADGWAVTATARSDSALAALREAGATALALDVTRADSVAGLAWPLDGAAFEVVVIVAGVYGPRTTGLQPPTDADFDAVMHTNVLGPMRVASLLGEVFAPNAALAILSSRMGAIGPRTANSGWLYRASKAAVNSVLKDASIEFAGRATCISFHPGWVQTDMGGGGATLTPEQSVRSMRSVIAGLTRADNGRYFDHDGTPIDW